MISPRWWLAIAGAVALAIMQWRFYDFAHDRGAAKVQTRFDQWKADQAEVNAKALAQEIAAAAFTAKAIAGILAGAADRIAAAKPLQAANVAKVKRDVEAHPDTARVLVPAVTLSVWQQQAEASRAIEARARAAAAQ